MGTKAAVTHPRSPPANEREDDDRLRKLAGVGDAVDILRVLDAALERADDGELGRLAADVREAERIFEEWARQVEAFRASKQLFDSGILPDPGGRPRGIPEELVLARLGRALDASPRLRFVWEALAFMVGFVLSLLVT
jgi:hypothetical protein